MEKAEKNETLFTDAVYDELCSELDGLSGLEQGSKEHQLAINDLKTLEDIYMNVLMAEQKMNDESERFEFEQEKFRSEQEARRKHEADEQRWNKIKIAGSLGLSAIQMAMFVVFWNQGMKYEETGTFTGGMFRHLRNLDFFKPKFGQRI